MKVLLITCILFFYIYFDAFLTSDYSSTTVNRNLVGSGCMLTDQKKKLLWENKTNTAAEEVICLSTHKCFTLMHLDLFPITSGLNVQAEK